MKFRKRPVVIDAEQLTPSTILKVVEFIHGKQNLESTIAQDRWEDYKNIVLKEGLKLKTLESDGEYQVASMNDWIIKGIKGEFYPCKPDIFKETYEPESVEEDAVEFAEWIDYNDYICTNKGMWTDGVSPSITTKELYTLFKQSKEKE